MGFELEFSGIGLEHAKDCLIESLGGEVVKSTAATQTVEVPDLGPFIVEIDWQFLKDKAAAVVADDDSSPSPMLVEKLSEAAPLLVPIEVVCPPIPISQLHRLDALVTALRDAGAQGTAESLIAAYGVHINPEVPSLDGDTLLAYLRAFAALQWWLVEAHDVDRMRKLSPYIDLWPEAYLRLLFSSTPTDTQQLIDDYLAHNATRNRALDCLPLFAEIDEKRVQAAVDDPRVKPRPTFHYRMPNCAIDVEGWSLAESWSRWCAVERLASDTEALKQVGEQFLAMDRPVIGVDRKAWIQWLDEWLADPS